MLVAATSWGCELVTPTEDAIDSGGSGDGANGSTDPFSSTKPSIAYQWTQLKFITHIGISIGTL